MMKSGVCLFAFAASLMTTPLAAQRTDPAAEAKEILKRSVAFRTVPGEGQVPAYAAYIASVLKQAGFADSDIEITPMGETATLVARYRGTNDAKPIVLIGHMDVVPAMAADWERDPFKAVEENGYIYGRGAEDNKFDVTMMVATLARLKREGYRPKRSIILALSGDEEVEGLTAQALAKQLKGAEMVLNGDAGGGAYTSDFKPVYYGVQAAEKTYADYQIAVTDAGGHSSAPTPTNAIYRLAHVLERIEAYHFPNQVNDLTRASLTSVGKRVGGELGAAMGRFAANPADDHAADLIAAHPEYVGQIRTTCVATMASAGDALNALPQRATANINCRIFPGVSIESVRAELERVANDSTAKITIVDHPMASDASPLRPDLIQAVTRQVRARYPKLEVTPGMSAGATDGLYYRAAGVPSYGVSPLFQRSEDSFPHGLNERVRVAEIAPALAFYRGLVLDLTR
jgi:acetylornithine deacetylase/succinyl-diaminopimelate desuccinylase-like protein